MTDLEQILKQLPNLSSDELQQIRKRVLVLIDLGAGETTQTSKRQTTNPYRSIVLQAVCDFVAEKGIEALTLNQLERSSLAGQSFDDKVTKISKLCRFDEFTTIEVKAILSIGLKALYAYLIDGLPTSWNKDESRLIRAPLNVGSRELIIFIGLLPMALERCFPGYGNTKLWVGLMKQTLYEGRLG